jgi:O-antigen ligase
MARVISSDAGASGRSLIETIRGLPWVWAAAVGVAALAGLAPPLVPLGVIAGTAFGILLFKRPVWGAYALVLSVPVQDVVKLPGGINVTQAVFVLVLGVCWMWIALRENRRIVLTPIAATLFIFFVTTLPSLWGTTSLPESLAELSRWLVTIFSYIIIINSIQTRREMNGLVVVMLLSGMAESLLGLVQAYGGLGPSSFNVEGILTRAYGTIGAPNSFAGYLNMSVPLAMALAAYLWGKWWSARKAAPLLDRPLFVSWAHMRNPILMTGVALVLFWTMVTTLSRGAWIGLAFGVLVMVLCLGKRASGAIGILVVGSMLLVGLGLIGALPPVISDRVDLLLSQLTVFDPRGVVPTPDDYAVVERMVHWQVAGNMFLSSPWTGVGIGNFNVLFTKFGVQGWPYSRGHAHNYYLHLLAEVGIIGFLGYMTMLVTAFTVGLRALRMARARLDGYGEAVVIGALGVLTTFAVHNFFENLHALNMGIHWGAALALFTLTWLRATEDERQTTKEAKAVTERVRPSSLVLRPMERQ